MGHACIMASGHKASPPSNPLTEKPSQYDFHEVRLTPSALRGLA